jgi:hypothetical protein
MPTISGAAANTKKKQPPAGFADLDEYGNHALDWSNVDCVDYFPHFLKVTFGKGHKHPSPFGHTSIAYGLSDLKRQAFRAIFA